MDTYTIWTDEHKEEINILINELPSSFDHVFSDDEIASAIFDQQQIECQV